jgi:hypothetical protein
MAASASTVSLTYKADIRDLVNKLKSVPGITEAEARKSAAALDKSLKAIAKASQQTQAKAKGASDGLKALGEAGDRAGRDAQKLSGILGALSPELGALASGVNDAGDALDVLGSSGGALLGPLGVLGAAVGALGLAYVAVQGNIDRAAESQRQLAKISLSTEGIERRLEDAYIDQAVDLGALTEAEGKRAKSAAEAQRGVKDFAEAQKDQREEIQKTIATSERYLEVTRGLFALLPEGTREFTDQFNVVRKVGDAVFGWTDSIEAGEKAQTALDGKLLDASGLFKLLRQKADEATGASDGYTAAVKRSTEGLDRTNDLYAELRQREEARKAALLELAQIAESSQTSEAPRLDAILERREMELARVDELVAATGALEKGEAARAAIVQETDAAIQDQRVADLEKLTGLPRRADEEALRAVEQRRDSYREAGSVIAGSLGEIATALEGAEGASEEQRAAAFRVAKGIAIASAVINTAQAVTAALTLPPPLGEIAAVAVGIAGAVQIATIASTEPSYHQGGMVSNMAPDEVRGPRMTGGEGVLTARGVRSVGGPSAVAAANEGRSASPAAPQGSPGVIAVLTPPGSPTRLLRDALRSTEGAAMVRSASRPSVLRATR